MTGVYAFDLYGTLLDVHSAVARLAERVGPEAAAVSQLWRTKQLEYAFVRGLAGRSVDFDAVTAAGLDYALAVHPPADLGVRADLLRAYRRLDAYPDAAPVLEALRTAGARTCVLSNGDPDALADALAAAGLDARLDAVLSASAAGTFKTAPAVYQLALDRFDVAAEAVTFVSSNRWDVAGARAFGFRPIWVNRTGAPDEYPDLPPHRVIDALGALTAEA